MTIEPTESAPAELDKPRGLPTWVALFGLLIALMAWIWPIGVGGQMPVGGDVTRFQIGLMGVYQRALQEGRNPLWNDLWGYGFPGLAESQMGVYYPPHRVLYGFLFTEAAYTLSLVLHTLFGGLGAFWAARRFGATSKGAVLGTLAWSASGFFVIHLAHQWAYTVGAWLPWAWGLAWGLASGTGTRRDILRLSAVLTLQVLPGHFQLAFITQVGVLLLALWGLVERPAGEYKGVRCALALMGAIALVIPLASLQFLPTWELARQAADNRDFAYLSAFAVPPPHWISLVTPGLFHHSPLWRPLVWDPLHAMPEEHLAYLGLMPLLLAFRTIRRHWRDDQATRALGWLAMAFLLLSMGPYVPGFRFLIRLPGFSFFRAPARCEVGLLLALALLAAKGIDGLNTDPKFGRSILKGIVAVVIIMGLAVGGIELAFAADRGLPGMAKGFDSLLSLRPWSSDPGFKEIMADTRRAPRDSIIEVALLRQGIDPAKSRLDRDRFRIYGEELVETGVVLLGMLVLAILARRGKKVESAVIALTILDLGLLARHRAVDTAPMRPLVEQSRVLSLLGKSGRVFDGLGNLGMVAGAAPLTAYRTLDRPVMTDLNRLASSFPGAPKANERNLDALKATGATARLFNPYETPALQRSRPDWPGTLTVIDDPSLAAWEFGKKSLALRSRTGNSYALWRPWTATPTAWLIPESSNLGEPSQFLKIMQQAVPLSKRSVDPEHASIDLVIPKESSEPGVVLLAQLDDRHWRGVWEKKGSILRELAVHLQVFTQDGGGSWLGFRAPKEPGEYRLVLTYDPPMVRFGILISGVAWLGWLLAYWRLGRRTVPDSLADLTEKTT